MTEPRDPAPSVECHCGSLDGRSARFGHPHLKWCQFHVAPQSSANETPEALIAEAEHHATWTDKPPQKTHDAQLEDIRLRLADHRGSPAWWDDVRFLWTALTTSEQEKARLVAMAEEWKRQASNWRKGQQTREKRGDEILAACATALLDALTPPTGTTKGDGRV